MLQKGRAEGIFSLGKAYGSGGRLRSGLKRSVLYP